MFFYGSIIHSLFFVNVEMEYRFGLGGVGIGKVERGLLEVSCWVVD